MDQRRWPGNAWEGPPPPFHTPEAVASITTESSEIYTFTIDQNSPLQARIGGQGRTQPSASAVRSGLNSTDPNDRARCRRGRSIIADPRAGDESFTRLLAGVPPMPMPMRCTKHGWYLNPSTAGLLSNQDGDLFVTGRVDDMDHYRRRECPPPVESRTRPLSVHPRSPKIALAGLPDEALGGPAPSSAFQSSAGAGRSTRALDTHCRGRFGLAKFQRRAPIVVRGPRFRKIFPPVGQDPAAAASIACRVHVRDPARRAHRDRAPCPAAQPMDFSHRDRPDTSAADHFPLSWPPLNIVSNPRSRASFRPDVSAPLRCRFRPVGVIRAAQRPGENFPPAAGQHRRPSMESTPERSAEAGAEPLLASRRAAASR